jgi:hypothetical protein
VAASAATRRSSALSRAITFGIGFLLGLAPFLFSFFEPVTYLIPLSLRDALRATTAVLGGLLALTVRGGEPLGRYRRKVLQTWAYGAVVGLILLIIFQMRFIVPVPTHSGLIASEIVAQPRLTTCPCDAVSDAKCLGELTLDPIVMDRCWDGARRLRNRLMWAFGYLLLVGGGQSFVGLLWSGWARARAESVWRRTGVARDLFLSYSRRDKDFALRLVGDVEELGFTVWLDRQEMVAGDPLLRNLGEAISLSACFGIILSPHAVASEWVRKELELALTRETEGGFTILPILHRPCKVEKLSPWLKTAVWADFFTSSYSDGLESLLGSLTAQRSQRAPPEDTPTHSDNEEGRTISAPHSPTNDIDVKAENGFR